MRMQFVGSLMTLLVIGHVGAQSEDLELKETTTRSSKYNVWVALMDSELTYIICGASIIDDRQALTLARCVLGRNKNDYKLVVYEYPGLGASTYNVDSVVFRSQDPGAMNDLAIVRIAETIRATSKKIPSCLSFRHPSDDFLGTRIKALGWKSIPMSDDSGVDVMVYRRLNVISSIPCNYTDDYLKRNDLCNELGNREEGVMYYGGEPVYWKCPRTNVQVQVGIITSRMTDDRIFMLRIGSFLGWIEKHIFGAGKFCEYEKQ